MCKGAQIPKHIKNILVVDDEENTRIGLRALLSAEGYQVASACDGGEALDCLNTGQYELVITDINMPHMDGMVFLDQLSQRHPNLDVIMITAFGGVDSYLEAMNLGAYEYLYKPVKIEDLRSVMQKLTLERSVVS